MCRMIQIALAFALAGLLALPAGAQKTAEDPRPLSGLDRSSIPTYSSVQAALDASPPADLTSAARLAGQAPISTRPVPVRRNLGRTQMRDISFEVERLERAENGTVRWMEGELSEPLGAGKSGAAYGEIAFDVLQKYADDLRLTDPRGELRLLSASTDGLGMTHARFEQQYEGIPVWGRDLYVHFETDGVVNAINGTYEPTPVDIKTTPRISSAAARETVVADLKARQRWAPVTGDAGRQLGLDEEEIRLVLYPDPEKGIRLAYEVSLHPNLLEWYLYLVDARGGEILNRIARHCTIRREPDPPPATTITLAAPQHPSNAGTFVDASALDLHGQTQHFRTYRHDDGQHYLIYDFPNYDAAASEIPGIPAGGAVTLTANNNDLSPEVLDFVTSPDNTWNDLSSVSAHANMRITYDYFKNVHGRDAIDDGDQSLISVVHVARGGQPMDNAFWTGRIMAYGDGRQLFEPVAGAVDISAHEMSHGVVQHTANLVYQFESGALNESFADVFALMVDRDDFLLGEDVMQPGAGPAMRDFLNPDNGQLRQPQPAHMDEFREMPAQQDNGGVHVNSGIPNRAAALIVQDIGHDKTEQIYYRALANYLTRNSQFIDARNAVEQSAADLYGTESSEVAAVNEAFDAVGITGDQTDGDGPEDNDVQPVTGGRSLLTFMMDDGTIGLLDLTDPNNIEANIFAGAEAVARVSQQGLDRAQLTTARNGERIWFINQQRQLAFLDVETGQVHVHDLQIQQPGDLWNASISPDESYVMLTSAYQNDPTLYLFDGEQLAAIPIEPESTQEGIQVQTVAYPDVVAWSPNPQFPRLGFDALNTVADSELGGPTYYWSMYELDFAAGNIYPLIPAQPPEISIGNITFSNTNPDVVAFNVLAQDGTADIVLADFEAGAFASLDIPSYTYDGTAVTDGTRPSFAPDDSGLAFSSAGHGGFFFFDFAADDLSFFDVGTPVYNPRWFVSGGQTSEEDPAKLPSTVRLDGNSPNPFNPSTVLRFELPAPSDVTLAIYDLLGRRVATLVNGPRAAGRHEVRFQADGLPSGTYVARLQVGAVVRTQKLTLLR